MIGGLIVVVCVVVVLALAETLVPRLICAYVLWRQERARAQSNAPAELGKVKVEKVERVEEVGEVEKVERVERVEEVEKVGGAEAEKLWAEACGMTPSEIPSFETDWHYMTLVHKAAELGHAEAMSALGDFAFQRGDVVEAFYWKLRVEMGGGRCRNPSLANIISVWTEVGCPDGSEDIGAGLSEQRADFAHAVLCLKSRVDPRYGTVRLKELADAGDEDATRFLKRR